MKRPLLLLACSLTLAGCGTKPIQWQAFDSSQEAEYEAYAAPGKETLGGQGFWPQNGGGTVKAAGRTVTLDPATSIGKDWYQKTSGNWAYRDSIPPSEGFLKYRKTTTADAEGRFKFSGIPPGKYYAKTVVTWNVGSSLQGGSLVKLVEVKAGEDNQVILSP